MHHHAEEPLIQDLLDTELAKIAPKLPEQKRGAVLREVTELLQAEIEEGLAAGTLEPARLNVSIHDTLVRVVERDAGASAA